MKINVIASSHPNFVAKKEEWDNFSGKVAGVCYMPSSFDDLVNEDITKTQKRVSQTKNNQHHSVYDHEQVSLYLDGIPKILAMFINNEKMYTTSEKSARYTKMILTDDEQAMFDKWLDIFSKLIRDKYQEKFPEFFNDRRIAKLAQENARYLISVFTPTSMVYTVSYRQLNILYDFMKKFIDDHDNNDFENRLSSSMKDFCKEIEKLDYLDDQLIHNNKNRKFSLLQRKDELLPVEYFGDVYATTYKASFAQLAQAQRHRTLSYKMKLLDTLEFFVPPIIEDDKELVKMWREDCHKQQNIYPQGMQVLVSELGTYENFILKMKERKCTFAQLEINDQTNEILKKYVKALQLSHHPKAEDLKLYTKGSRCTFPGFTCTDQCHFADGVKGTRKI